MEPREDKLTESLELLAGRLFSINRSLTGDGNRKTLDILAEFKFDLDKIEVPSGTQVYDWVVPPEWKVDEAYISTLDGYRIVDFSENFLHLVGYSAPVEKVISLSELLPKVHSLPENPSWIPYRTTYYNRSWGFCVPHQDKVKLSDKSYNVVIKSELNEKGSLV